MKQMTEEEIHEKSTVWRIIGKIGFTESLRRLEGERYQRQAPFEPIEKAPKWFKDKWDAMADSKPHSNTDHQ
jgi:hypothetical protein